MTTTTRTQDHATFVIERTYDQPVATVWRAFADPATKKEWFAGPHDLIAWEDDFQVDGHGVSEGELDGRVSLFRSTYRDIVDQERIVYAYDMWLDGVHASTSITTIVLEPAGDGTLLTFTEQGVHLDGVHGPAASAGREEGTGWLLGQIAEVLGR